ncbi:methyltransferase domain-containing protein [Pseudonocardia yuanmonensis]|uniref:Methyltransferase domain-containing protein n=1 Tax=Pseudonocardia yuanmonensis TaxID=1095914 RepID=A0ABP8WQV3_9PSEU
MPNEQDRVWVDAMPRAYADGLEAAVFAPFAAELARRAAATAPRRVLEVAAGTGVVTRALAEALPGTDLLATDLNPAMVRYGGGREARARWEQADAAHLPAGDGTVDLAVCGFGVMFFPDRPAAYTEVRRVLTPGGRFLFTAWDEVRTHAFAEALTAGLRAAFPADPPPFVAAVPHGYADPDRIRADLAGAGFTDVDLERVVRTGTAPSAAAVAEGFCTGTPLRAQIAERGEPAAALRTVGDTMTALLGAGEVRGEMAAWVAEARR